MHTKSFHDWLSYQEDYKDWVNEQGTGKDTSTYSYLDSLTEDEVDDLKDKYDEHMRQKRSSMGMEDNDKDY